MTLSAHELTVRVGDKTLIEKISLDIRPGEITAIVGANGAGKSTLLKAMTGDLKPDGGAVIMDGRPLEAWSLPDRARVRGILAQSVPLHFAFTVLEVVLMGRSPHIKGRESARDYEIVRQALAMAEVSHLEGRTYTTLSGGERQRVHLARVLAQIWEPVNGLPRYLLMDEPTNNLDLTHQHGALQAARQFAAEGVGVMVILHDLNLASEYADHVMFLLAGRSLCTGTPAETLTAENIMEAFNMPAIIARHPVSRRPLVVPVASGHEADNLSAIDEHLGVFTA